MSTRKAPSEAARLCEARARQGKQQYAKPEPKPQPLEFSTTEIFQALEDNENGDARLVIESLRGRYVCDKQRKLTFRYNGQHWEKDILDSVYSELNKALIRIYRGEALRQSEIIANVETAPEDQKSAIIRRKKLNQRCNQLNTLPRQEKVLRLACSGLNSLAISGNEWNLTPWALPSENALINLKTGQARPGQPEDYINKAAPARWEGLHANAPAWEAFLESTFESPEVIRYVQKMLGMALTGKANQQEFYILWGEGRNGKGTLMETVKEILGPLADPIRSEMLMETQFQNNNSANPEVLDMQGKRIVWASETKKNQRLNVEKIKLFSGDDTLKARYNYANDIIAFKPTHTLMLLTNHMPRVDASEGALWHRLRLIPFKFQFVDKPQKANERQKDPNLPNKLAKEGPGILAWLVRGCLAWQAEGLIPPQEIEHATLKYRTNEDVYQQFIVARCHIEPNNLVQAGIFYAAFTKWYAEEYGDKARIPGKKPFSIAMSTKFEKDDTKRHTYYYGLRLKEDDE